MDRNARDLRNTSTEILESSGKQGEKTGKWQREEKSR